MFNEFSRRQGTETGPVPTPDDGFLDPGSTYAPSMFWFWNDTDNIKQPEHYAAMAAEMCDKGTNPGFVHARLFRSQVPFWLSDDWYKCFGAALKVTEEHGMHMSYCMGDPSFPDKYLLADHHDFPGFPVGGIELYDHPELKAVSLDYQIINAGGTVEIPASFFSVAAKVEANGKINSESLRIVAKENTVVPWTPPDDGNWRVYCFNKVYNFPSQYKINFLDRRLAEPWLELENSKYEALFGKDFGKTMGGVFFDLEGFFGYKLTWSDDLAEYYAETVGTDIRERMPLLLEEDTKGLWLKSRHDWFAAVAVLYAECVFEPLVKWCSSHRMYQSCHYWEEALLLQSTRMADYMAMQRCLSMPGIDALFDTIHDPRHFKEAQSVCEFEGRQLMCEMLSIGGWHLTPAELKRSANAAIAMGITQFVLHGANASRDPLKVSYPPDFFDWNPYWRYFRQYGDFVRRASYVNDHGRLDAEVLLYCPLASVNALVGDDYFDMSVTAKNFWDEDMLMRNKPEIKTIEDAYTTVTRKLYDERIDYCVADRHYLNKMQVENGCLNVGDFSFRTMILPPLKIIDLDSAAKLATFAETGGKVYALGTLPVASVEHGGSDAELATLMSRLSCAPGFVSAAAGIEPVIAELKPCVTFVAGTFPMIATRRKIGRRSFFWLTNNTGDKHQFTLRISDVSGAAELWNCETGARPAIPLEVIDADTVQVNLTLDPGEGLWLVFDPDKAPTAATEPPCTGKAIELPENWLIKIDPDDQPPSNFPAFAIPEKLIAGTTIPCLSSWLDWGLEKFSGFVDYTQTVKLASVTGSERLDLGEVKHTAEVWINGKSAGARMWPPFVFEIGNLLRPGQNEIKIKVGNLILNAVTRYEDYPWNWYQPPTKEQLDCGVFGPVRLHTTDGASAVLYSAPCARET
mgnify:CR=1 FL=1